MSESRRLSAIAFTDMVGFTSMAQRDEAGALQMLESHNAIVRSVLGNHGGREVKTIGDAFLLEFDSALEAVLCAIEIQAEMRDYNSKAMPERRMNVRVGIHVGDVVHRDGDVFGDSVNIASRIVAFAESGGICISEQVFAQVRNKVPYPLSQMPQMELKHVGPAMNLYTVVLPWSGTLTRSPANRIAILPFANISPDPSDAYFADGLTDEMISALSEVKDLRVIARTSVNKYRSTDRGISQIGAELQVPHILEGSVRKAGNKVRVTAQLIDVESQEHEWSGQYDREVSDVFSIQSDIAQQVASALKVKLLSKEQWRLGMKDTENPLAYVAYLKGRALLHDRTERAIKGAKEQFEMAINQDPGYAQAYAGLADAYILLGDYLFSPFPESLGEAKVCIRKALELDPELAEARVSLASSLVYEYRFAEAEREFRTAIALNPSYATAHHWYSNCLQDLDRLHEAFREVTIAEELDPQSSAIALSVVYVSVALANWEEAAKRVKKIEALSPGEAVADEASMIYHFWRQEWEETLKYLLRLIERDPTDPYLDADLAYVHAVNGRRQEALDLVRKLEAVPLSSGVKCTLLAFVYAGLDDLDACFRWLDEAFANQEAFFGWFRISRYFANVRKDPRFDALLRRANLVP